MSRWTRVLLLRKVRQGLFPLDEQLAIDRGSLSPALARELAWLRGVVAYAKFSQVLERMGRYQIPPSTLCEHLQQHGERLIEYQAHW